MGLLKGDIEKVPKDLSLKEYYARIYDWHKSRRDIKKNDNPSTKRYHELVESLPNPEKASPEDIVFVCKEVITGLMEWAYHKMDEYEIKTAAYAHYILNTFFDGFHGEKMRVLEQKSELYRKYRKE